MNIIDVTKNWFVLISASGTTDDVSKWKHGLAYYRHLMLYYYYGKFKFQKGQTTEI